MTRRVVATYRSNDSKTSVRLYIKDGAVVNPDVDALLVKDMGNYTLHRIRKTGEATRRFYEAQFEDFDAEKILEEIRSEREKAKATETAKSEEQPPPTEAEAVAA